MYHFLEGARSYDSIPSPAHAREAAAEFGRFQALLRDLPGPRLNETIPDFHNTPVRYAQFYDARKSDTHDRARHCLPEIEWALAQEQFAGSLCALKEAGDIPECGPVADHRRSGSDCRRGNLAMTRVDRDRAAEYQPPCSSKTW